MHAPGPRLHSPRRSQKQPVQKIPNGSSPHQLIRLRASNNSSPRICCSRPPAKADCSSTRSSLSGSPADWYAPCAAIQTESRCCGSIRAQIVPAAAQLRKLQRRAAIRQRDTFARAGCGVQPLLHHQFVTPASFQLCQPALCAKEWRMHLRLAGPSRAPGFRELCHGNFLFSVK